MQSLESTLLLLVAALTLGAAFWLGRRTGGTAPEAVRKSVPAPKPEARPAAKSEKKAAAPAKSAEPEPRRVLKEEHSSNEEEDAAITQVSSRAELEAALRKGKEAEKAPAAESKPAAKRALSELEMPTIEAPTQLPVRVTDEVDSADHTQPIALFLVTATGRTDTGRRRARNEDMYLELPEHFLWAVADGMGGHAAGEVASQLAVTTVEQCFLSGDFGGEPDAELPSRGDELVRSIKKANLAVHTQAAGNPAQAGMGTTFVSTRFSPNKKRVYVAHVGDSRCYRMRGSSFTQLTRDHTLGAALGIKGKAAGKLLRAVGTEDTVEVDLVVDEPNTGDHYILCSDGLFRMVSDDEIRTILTEESDLQKAVARLITVANEHGGVDNVTVIVVRVQAAPVAAEAPAATEPG